MSKWNVKNYKDGTYEGSDGQRFYAPSMVEENGVPLSQKILAMLHGNIVAKASANASSYEFDTDTKTGKTTYCGLPVDIDDVEATPLTSYVQDFTDIETQKNAVDASLSEQVTNITKSRKKSLKSASTSVTEENTNTKEVENE